MRRISFFLAATLLAAPVGAKAQNADQIARVKAGAHCPRCNLFQADLANLNLRGRNLAGARLRQADISTAEAARARFSGGDDRDLNAYGAVLTGADFSRSDLTNASFVGAYLGRVNFAGAKLDGVNFSGADMKGAGGLSPARLAGACGDATTRLPKGVVLKACN